MNQRNALILATIVIAGLAWVDPVFIPVILLGPIASGAVAGARGIEPRLVAIPWFAAGLITLVLDLAINGEDVAFHAAVALFTAVVAAGVSAAVMLKARRGTRRARRRVLSDAAPPVPRGGPSLVRLEDD